MNVFKAISGLAIIPTASSDKYRHRLKSPSGRQAALGERVDGGSAINKSAGTPPQPCHHCCCQASVLVCVHSEKSTPSPTPCLSTLVPVGSQVEEEWREVLLRRWKKKTAVYVGGCR